MAEEDVQENLPQPRTAMIRRVRVSPHETIGLAFAYISYEKKSVGILLCC